MTKSLAPTPPAAAPVTIAERAEIAARHRLHIAKYVNDDGRVVLREHRCAHCGELWPCDTARLEAALARQASVLAMLRALFDQPAGAAWAMGYVALRAAVQALEAEA